MICKEKESGVLEIDLNNRNRVENLIHRRFVELTDERELEKKIFENYLPVEGKNLAPIPIRIIFSNFQDNSYFKNKNQTFGLIFSN